MSKTEVGYRRGAISRPALALTGLLMALAVTVTVAFMSGRGSSELTEPGRGLNISLLVEPFEVGDSVGGNWDAAGFADSLATQLSVVPGIHATTTRSGARYVLRGNVAMKDGRLILATRLGRDGERDTVWTATFWRSTTSGSSVLTDVATAVAEAVMSENVKQTLNARREKP